MLVGRSSHNRYNIPSQALPLPTLKFTPQAVNVSHMAGCGMSYNHSKNKEWLRRIASPTAPRSRNLHLCGMWLHASRRNDRPTLPTLLPTFGQSCRSASLPHPYYAHSTTEREGAEVQEGLIEQAIPLLTSQDILQLTDEEIIGFHRHLPPFRLRRMDWRGDPILA